MCKTFKRFQCLNVAFLRFCVRVGLGLGRVCLDIEIERTASAIVWQLFVLSQVEVVDAHGDLPEDEGYEGDGDDQHVEQVEPAPTESVFVQDEPVGDDLQNQLDSEDGGEKVVKIVENLQEGN